MGTIERNTKPYSSSYVFSQQFFYFQTKKKILEKKLRDKEIQSWQMAQNLKSRLGKYNNFRVFYVREGTHEKIFCFDEENILIGSCNLLSYDGGQQENYSGFKFRYEGGVLIKDKEFASKVMHDFECSVEEVW